MSRLLPAGLVVLVFFVIHGLSLTGCTKTNTVHDTTTLTLRDTITIRDTTVIKDTVIINDTLGNLSDGLIAYYNFNGGNLNDSSGHGNNIVFNNATPTVDRFGNPNNAYLFDGSTSYMTVKNSPSLNPNNITIYAIVKPFGFNYAPCHTSQIIGKLTQDPENGIYALRFGTLNSGNSCDIGAPPPDSTKEFFNGFFGDDIPQGTTAYLGPNANLYIQKGQWYTVIYTYDGKMAKLFINGALVDSLVTTVTLTPNPYDLYIGATPNPTFPYYLNGAIDEIRIYNKAITNQQVTCLNILKNKYLKIQNKLIY